MCVYSLIKRYNGKVNTLHWLFLACVWYVLDTCWIKQTMLNRWDLGRPRTSTKWKMQLSGSPNGQLGRLIRPPLYTHYRKTYQQGSFKLLQN
mgnify:FL=1